MSKLYLVQNVEYTFNIINRFFAENLPIVTTSSVGGTRTGEITSGVVNTWQTESGELWTGSVVYETNVDTLDLEVYTNDASIRQKTQLQKLIIKFTPSTTGTFYIQCANTEGMGKELDVNSGYGDVVNSEEVYHTLLLRQTNRTYSFAYNSDMFDKFIENYIPSSAWPRFVNLAPEINSFSNDKSFYDPNDEASLSALITDPESDILSYAWTHASPLLSVSGQSLTSTISGASSSTCSVQLTAPPVETLYTFRMTTSDSDNTTVGNNQVPVYAVSGILLFSGWGQTDFLLGDAGLSYSYYPDAAAEDVAEGDTLSTSLSFETTISGALDPIELELEEEVDLYPGLSGVVISGWTISGIADVVSGVSYGDIEFEPTISGIITLL